MANKATNAKDLRSKSDVELSELVDAAKNGIFEARFQNYTNRLNDTSKIGKLRRELARLYTVQSERRHAAKEQTAAAKGEAKEQ